MSNGKYFATFSIMLGILGMITVHNMNRIHIVSGIAVLTIGLLLVTTTMSGRQSVFASIGSSGASASGSGTSATANAGNGVSAIASISGSSVSAVANAGNDVSASVVIGVATLS